MIYKWVSMLGVHLNGDDVVQNVVTRSYFLHYHLNNIHKRQVGSQGQLQNCKKTNPFFALYNT